MPLPAPREGEDKNAFISRCLSDPVMKKEYPEIDQRVAVCSSEFDKNNNEKKTPGATTRDSFNI